MNRKEINNDIVGKIKTIDAEILVLKLALDNKNWNGATGIADSISCLTLQISILDDELEFLRQEEKDKENQENE